MDQGTLEGAGMNDGDAVVVIHVPDAEEPVVTEQAPVSHAFHTLFLGSLDLRSCFPCIGLQ